MLPPNVPFLDPRAPESPTEVDRAGPARSTARAENARRGVSILMVGVFLSASVPGLARADVSLPPPPPPKKGAIDLPPPPPKSGGASSGSDLPPPPKKKGGGEGGGKSGEGGGGGSSGGGGGGSSSPKRNTALVLLVTGGVVTVAGSVMLLLGAGLKPTGKKTGSGNTGLLVSGAVTTGVGLTVAAIGLVLLLDSNNGRLPPIRSLELPHPATRTPEWASLPMPGHDAPPAFVLPLGGTF